VTVQREYDKEWKIRSKRRKGKVNTNVKGEGKRDYEKGKEIGEEKVK